jgi:hypothetical protein
MTSLRKLHEGGGRFWVAEKTGASNLSGISNVTGGIKPEACSFLIVFDGPGLCAGQLRHLRYFTLEYHG